MQITFFLLVYAVLLTVVNRFLSKEISYDLFLSVLWLVSSIDSIQLSASFD